MIYVAALKEKEFALLTEMVENTWDISQELKEIWFGLCPIEIAAATV